MFLKNKFLITLLVPCVFIITNPSLQAFKDYLGVSSSNGISRKNNYFLCSKFKKHNKYYLGVLGNFFLIEYEKVQSQNKNEVMTNDAISEEKVPNNIAKYDVYTNDLLDTIVNDVLKGRRKKYSKNDMTASQVDSVLNGIKR